MNPSSKDIEPEKLYRKDTLSEANKRHQDLMNQKEFKPNNVSTHKQWIPCDCKIPHDHEAIRDLYGKLPMSNTNESFEEKLTRQFCKALGIEDVNNCVYYGGDNYTTVRDLVVQPVINHNRECAERSKVVAELIEDLTDDDECSYDHHGYCQAHGWVATDPKCPHARAKAFLTSLSDKGESDE